METISTLKHVLKNLIFGSVLVLVFLQSSQAFSQGGCDPSVPTYVVDLTGQPNGTYISPPDIRNGNCCGTLPPDQCIQFILTLDPMSNGIIFSIASGAIPPGAIFYQVNCGPPTPVGNMLCLTGVGPHYITFCKPGNNTNTYQITALAQPQSGPDVTATAGCSQPLYVNGLDAASTTWTSIFPGPNGTYNSYLSCTSGCDSVTVTPGMGAPPYVDYLVCGYVYGGCFPFTYCDTIRVNINQDLTSVNTNINCFGQTTGAVNLTVPGAGPVTYAWSNGAATEDISGLAAGNYSVTVTNADGCTRTLTATITQPTALNVVGAPTPINCFGASNGSINITPSGGTGPYSFNWNSGPTTEDISGLSAGSYTVIITDANNCTTSYSANITQPSAVTMAPTVVNVACFGGNAGSIVITPNGGITPYTFAWSNGATTQNISGLTAGSYSVIATDANGCTATTSATINQPAAPLTVNGVPTNILCFGGATGVIDITPSGGTGPYTYTWSNGSTTQDIAGLTPGPYSVTVTDANGCTNTSFSATITQPAAAVTVTGTTTNINCFGNNNGSINITPAGGVAPYTFTWSNGATTEDISGLPAASYGVYVTDANGCMNTSFTATIAEPPVFTTAPTAVNIQCFGLNTGSITLSTNGGNPGYSFLWNNGANTANISGLTAGTYTVIATDNNGCTTTTSATITQPASALAVNGTSTNINCFGNNNGSIDLTVSGGTPGYTYTWNNGTTTQDISGLSPGSYSVIVTDANGCTNSSYSTNITQPATALTVSGTSVDILCFGGTTGSIDISPVGGTSPYTYSWSNGASVQDISGLTPGSYSVLITDGNGCTNSSYSATIIQPAAAISVMGTSTNVLCNGGTSGAIDITPSGGTPAYSYLWSNGSTTQDLSGITAGSYTVTITDANGCINNTFTSFIAQPAAALSVNGTPLNPSCNGSSDGNITINPSGGTIPYIYNWSTGSSDKNIYNLPGGGYSVLITDGNGCSVTGDWSLLDPTLVNVISIIDPILCYGKNDASISLDIVGGTPPYNVHWNTGATSPTISGLGAGNYSVTVTDSRGCTNTSTYHLTSPGPLMVDLDSLYTIWLGESVTLEAVASGGTGAYTYSWNPPDHLSCIECAITQASPLINSSYGVTVTDQNGCTATAGAFIEVLFAIYVPNSFSPNGDSDNDIFLARSESVKDFNLRIFDRWGEEIFASTNINIGWEGDYKGAEAKQDVYVYRIEATFLNGKYTELIGQVNLIR